MAVKCTGEQFKRFYSDPRYWFHTADVKKTSTWHDDEVILIDGKEKDENFDMADVADDAQVSVEGGMVYGPVVGSEEPALDSYLRRWLKEQSTTSFLVTCDKDKLDAVKAAIKAAGGKIS